MGKDIQFHNIELESFVDFVRKNPDISAKESRSKWDDYYVNIIDEEFETDCDNVHLYQIEDKKNKINISLFCTHFNRPSALTEVFHKFTFNSSGYYFTNYNGWKGFISCEGEGFFDCFKQYKDFKDVKCYEYNVGKTNEIKIFVMDEDLDESKYDNLYNHTIGKYKNNESEWIHIPNNDYDDFNIFLKRENIKSEDNVLNIVKSRIRKRKLKKVLADEKN